MEITFFGGPQSAAAAVVLALWFCEFAVTFVMPTNAELAKRLDDLEAQFKDRMNKLVEKLVADVKGKLLEDGVDNSALRTEVSGMDESLSVLNEIVENTRTQQAELLAANKALTSENKALRNRIAEMEQYSRINNVEIKGVPFVKDEDCVSIVTAIAEKAACPLSSVEVEVAHRVPTKSGHQNIIARFCSRTKKAEFLEKARKARLDVGSLGFTGENNTEAIFINEHLTPDNKRLFAKALALKKEKGWRFLWTKNCRINARKSEDSRVRRINSEADLSVFV